jgi:hypothetical protein
MEAAANRWGMIRSASFWDATPFSGLPEIGMNNPQVGYSDLLAAGARASESRVARSARAPDDAEYRRPLAEVSSRAFEGGARLEASTRCLCNPAAARISAICGVVNALNFIADVDAICAHGFAPRIAPVDPHPFVCIAENRCSPRSRSFCDRMNAKMPVIDFTDF